MISQKTIQAVHDVELQQVIGAEIELKQKGADFTACCPFHGEKTPSFHISKTKQIYKCFGCGVGGNSGVSFVMEHLKLTYPEAIEHIANKHNILIEYEKSTKTQTPEVRNLRKDAERILSATQRRYHTAIAGADAALGYCASRGLTSQIINYFRIGWADGGSKIKAECIKKGLLAAAKEAGVVAEGSKGSYDVFQERITIPIHNHLGRLIGFGGRIIADSPYAKYINSPDTFLYKKDKNLYNLHRAAPHIKEAHRSVYLMEGYMDVIGAHMLGIHNAVASCGTAFTADQAKVLARYADSVVIWYDGDSAGRKATMKAAPILIDAGFKVSVLNQIGLDPFDYCHQIAEELQKEVEQLKAEAV
jgi:DNA primase